jgi:hypothetical protein
LSGLRLEIIVNTDQKPTEGRISEGLVLLEFVDFEGGVASRRPTV